MANPARRTVGVLAPVVGGFYFGAVIAGVARACRAGGHRVVAVQTYPAGLDREGAADPDDVPVALGAVDGLVVLSGALPHDRLIRLEASGLPTVLVSEELPSRSVPVVLPDNAAGVRASVEHLIKHGHRAIGFVGSLTQRDMRERFAAYRDTLAAHGLEADGAWVYEATDNNEPGGQAAARRLLAAGLPTTAVVVATDRNAAGLIAGLRHAGLAVPRDQAVVAFDHADFGARLNPRLTTVDAHFDRVGEAAVRLLLARLRGEVVPVGEHRTATSLVVRESCGCTPLARTDASRDDWRDDLLDLTRTAFFGGRGLIPGPHDPRTHRDVRPDPRIDVRGAAHADRHPERHPDRRAERHERRTPQEAWCHAVVEPLGAALGGTVPDDAAMARLAELTTALQPYPDALELLVAAVHRARDTLLAEKPDGTAPAALERTTTAVILALTRGCTAALLGRAGRLEATVEHQYEVAMDLLRDGTDPRTLEWLPRGLRGRACLALWVDGPGADRELEIVGVRDAAGALTRLVGTRTVPADFPPVPMLRGGLVAEATFVVPVTCGRSDWGLLAVEGPVEARSTTARDRFNHWAALLAVALDQQSLLSSLHEQRLQLEQSAARERALADAVRVSEEHYALASMAADDGTWDWDVSKGTVYYSPRWKQTLGYDDESVGSSPTEWLDRVHPADRDEVSTAIAASLAGVDSTLELEHRVRSASGDYRWLLCRAMTVLDDAGCPARLVGTIVDVTDRKQTELSQQRDALRDAETGLATRLLFLDRLGAAVVRAHRIDDYDCALVVVRAPQSAQSGGARGATSSGSLREVAERLRDAVRAGDTAARSSEDEVALLLEDTGPGGVPSRVRGVLDALVAAMGDRVRVGIVPSLRGYEDTGAVLREADIAGARAAAGSVARSGPR
jgi:PAS domain S-box-containing protein